MPRTARALATSAALSVALTGGLSACTGTGPGTAGDGNPGDSGATATQAAPGRYRTLPEPCGAVDEKQLKQMLPGTDTGTATASDALEGEPSVTYDTDRRVGCSWRSATSLGNRSLDVDFERVVSYDPAVGDDEEAEALYRERADDAGLSVPLDPDAGTGVPTGSPADDGTVQPTHAPDTHDSAGGDGPGDAPDGGEGTTAARATSGVAPSGSPSASTEPAPRTLDGIGDAAFLGDRLVTTENGRATHRDVTLVFRTSNVLVTVEYSQSVADEYRTPDSAELQKQAQQLARQLAGQFDDE